MKQFKLTHDIFPNDIRYFNETNAPKWLTTGGPPGSTMDMRWFWDLFMSKLEVGKSIKTDFHEITRLPDSIE